MNINSILDTDRNKACSKYGSQMGRRNRIGEPTKLHLQRVDFIDGDYDRGGAYWGSGGGPLYSAFSKDETTLVFVRATNRGDAKAKVIELLGEGWGFYASPHQRLVVGELY